MGKNRETLASSLSPQQECFFQKWVLAGGTNATAANLLEDSSDSILFSAADASGWQYLNASNRHCEVLQTRVTGYFRNHLSDRHFCFGSTQNDLVSQSGRPHVFGWPGAIGAAKSLWSERLVVPVAPPKGMTRAVVSHFSWFESAPRSVLATLSATEDWLLAGPDPGRRVFAENYAEIFDRLAQNFNNGDGKYLAETLLVRDQLEKRLFGQRWSVDIS